MFFKSQFPTEFWAGVARKAPTVVSAKVAYNIDHLMDDIQVAGHQVNFMPGQNSIFPAYQMARTAITAAWSTSAAAGPEPIVALLNALLADNFQKAEAIWEDIHTVPGMLPREEFSHFPEYNVQVEKVRFNASGYIKAGPSRAPYRDLPDRWRKQAKAHGKAWADLRGVTSRRAMIHRRKEHT